MSAHIQKAQTDQLEPTPLEQVSLGYLRGIPLYLKLEGTNPTGSHKDRIALFQINDCPLEAATFATCGNYGKSVTHIAGQKGIGTLVVIPGSYEVEDNTLSRILENGGIIIRYGRSYEEAVEFSKTLAHTPGVDGSLLYDANPGGEHNFQIQVQAYKHIALEIYEQLGKQVPDYVSVPVSNGTTLVGIYQGFKELFDANLIAKIPRLVAASVEGMNPIITSFNSPEQVYTTLSPDEVVETPHNIALVNYDSSDGEQAVMALKETSGYAVGVPEGRYTLARDRLIEEIGVVSLPESCAALEAVKMLIENGDIKDREAIIVIVLTS
jgi:threonine synthase